MNMILSHLVTAWRWRWPALALAWAICLGGWIAVALLPNRFESSARIYVDTETVLSPLMRQIAVELDVGRQVDVMQRTLLSRPNLESVLRMADLDITVSTPEEREKLLKALEKDVVIRAQGKNLFLVSYQNRDTELAKRVVQSLLTIFVESNLGNNRKDMEQARRFIESQILQYERQLKAAEDRFAQFRQQNQNYLSSSGNSFGAMLDQARAGLAETKRQLDDAVVRRAAMSKELATTPQFLEVQTAAAVYVDQSSRGPSALAQRVTEMEKSLDALLLRFTPQHPDVISSRKMLDQLRGQLAQEEAAGDKPTPQQRRAGGGRGGPPGGQTNQISNPVYEQTRLKLVDLESTVQSLERRYSDQKEVLVRQEERAKLAPEVEAQAGALDRDYKVIKKNYDDLLARREAARLSQEMDTKADKVQFRIIDPPTAPVNPASPNRPLLVSAVLAGGLGAAGALAFLLMQLSDSFMSPRQVRDAFNLPILGSVSVVINGGARRRKVLHGLAFASVLGALVAGYGGAMLHATGLLGDAWTQVKTLKIRNFI
jgi:polysaccharide chain length determinant protein (PEP-CTERM system associated)